VENERRKPLEKIGTKVCLNLVEQKNHLSLNW